MVVINEIYNDGKILNYKPDTDLSLDMFIFGKTNIPNREKFTDCCFENA